MFKAAIYLVALLKEAPINRPQLLQKKLDESDLSFSFINELIDCARSLVLSGNPTPQKSEEPYLYPILKNTFKETSSSFAFSLQELALSEDFFPSESPDGKVDKLWEQLQIQIDHLSSSNIQVLAENTLELLKKYAITIPCGYKGAETISYYDYAKTLAGISVCLYDWWFSHDRQTNRFKLEENDAPLLLINGDLSGIQSYIHEVVSKSAARNLKGRSFFLFLLADNLIDRLVKELGIFKSCIIYNSGGGFKLIAPNTINCLNSLQKFEKEILHSKLFDYFGTNLSCAIASAPLGINSKLTTANEIILKALREKKAQKFIEQVRNYDRLFNPEKVEQGGITARDIVTGEEINNNELNYCWYLDPDGERDIKPANKTQLKTGDFLVKESTAWQILLGQQLKKIDYWIKSTKSIPKLKRKNKHNYELMPLDLGIYNYFLNEEQWKDLAPQLLNEQLTINKINNLDTFEFHSPIWQIGYTFYGGNEGPVDHLENPKTFSEMAGAEDEEKKNANPAYHLEELPFKRLGILHMDVDNLGNLFKESVENEAFGLAHYSTLSRSLDYFFKGYLNTLWQKATYKNETQIIYAGGDDLFLVGRWDLMLELAESIKNEFNKWTGGNKNLSLSGGISIVTHKYPVMKAAKMAEGAEKRAKENNRGRYLKNSFTLFDTPLHWETKDGWMNEFELVKDLKNELVKIISDKGLSKGILVKIMQHELSRLLQEKTKQNQKWKWTTAYDLSQVEKRLRSAHNYRGEAFIKEIKIAVQLEQYKGKKLQSNHLFIALLAIAARWAELEQRTQKALAEKGKTTTH